MKIYTSVFDLSRPSPHRFWVAPFSDFKFGIKLVNAGAEVENTFTVTAGTTTLTPDADKIDGFTIYTTKSTDTGFVEYTITVNGIQQRFKLIQIITDSTVFEVGGGGGDVPADVATQSWVESQISDFVEQDDLTAYATKAELTDYVETSDLTAYAEKTDLTAYATKGYVDSAISDFVTEDDLTGYATTEDLSSKADKVKKIPADVSWWETTGDGWSYMYYDEEEGDLTAAFTKLTADFLDISEYCDYQVSAQYLQQWDGNYYKTHLFSYCTNGKTVFCHQWSNDSWDGSDYEGNITGNVSVYYEVDTTKIPDGENQGGNLESIVEGTAKAIGYVSQNMDGQAPYVLQELSTWNDMYPYQVGNSDFYHIATEHVVPGYVSADVVYEDSISSLASKDYVQMNYPDYTAFNNALMNKVDTWDASTAPRVQTILSYYESDYAQLSVDDPDWSPDQNTMYVILPDPE